MYTMIIPFLRMRARTTAHRAVFQPVKAAVHSLGTAGAPTAWSKMPQPCGSFGHCRIVRSRSAGSTNFRVRLPAHSSDRTWGRGVLSNGASWS
jgi:hypothetical protein